MFRKFLFFALSSIVLLSSCKEDYDKKVQRELSSGARYDSLFMGFYFGMPRSDFFKRCLELNQQGLVTNGPENNSVLYVIEDYDYTIDMNFYPDFENERIYKMEVVFNYQAWAPWNKQLFAGKLIPHALDILEKWFGGGFYKLETAKGKPYWAKIDGNREIILRVQNERNLRVEIVDRSVTPTPKPMPPSGGQRPVWSK
jgi:hypothetical protein